MVTDTSRLTRRQPYDGRMLIDSYCLGADPWMLRPPCYDSIAAEVPADDNYRSILRQLIKEWIRSILIKDAVAPSVYDVGRDLNLGYC